MIITRRAFTAALSLTGLGLLAGFSPMGLIDKAMAQSAADVAKPMSLPDMALGPANASVTITEYASMTCPHCAAFTEKVFPKIKSEYIDSGKIRFVFHPIAFIGPESTAAASAATAAGDQGKFWPYHDQLFAQQGPENSGTFSTGKLLAIGRAVGLTDQRFTTAVERGTYENWIAQQTDQASRRGVNQTPTVLVDGQMAPEAATPQGLQAAVDAALAAK